MMLLACGLCWAVPRPEIPRPEILQGPTRTSWYRIWQQADHDLWGSGLQSNSCSPHAWVCAEIHRTQSYRRSNAQPTTQLLGSYVASNSGSSKEITLLKGKTKLFTAYVCQSKVMSLIANGDVIDVRTGVTSLNRTPLLFPYKRSPGTEPQGGWKVPTDAGTQSPGYACVTYQRRATATSACATGRTAER